MTTAPATLPIFEDRRRLDRRQSDAERTLAVKEIVLEAARYLRCRKQFDAASMLLDGYQPIVHLERQRRCA